MSKVNLNFRLNDQSELSILAAEKGIKDWKELLYFIRHLPYGRLSNRSELKLVFLEEKGTCSSKHALLKKIAQLNERHEVDLVLGMYRMNQYNTPGIGIEMENEGLEYIPEAHCYLKINGIRLDVTFSDSNFKSIEQEIISEHVILPEQIDEYKVDYHKNFLEKWIIEEELSISFESLWKIREKCIQNLSNDIDF